MNLKTARVVGFVGKTFITTGLLLLGLVVYQLWGTGIETRRTQSALRQEFNRIIATTEPSRAGGASAFLPATRALVPANALLYVLNSHLLLPPPRQQVPQRPRPLFRKSLRPHHLR